MVDNENNDGEETMRISGSIFFLLFLPIQVLPCKLTSTSTWFFDAQKLVATTSTIYEAKLTKKNGISGWFGALFGYPRQMQYTFAVRRVLKGILPENQITATFNYSDDQKPNQISYGQDCTLTVLLEPGEVYLVFQGAFNPQSIRRISGTDDPWVTLVMEEINKAK